jgi:hypothetical protein
MVTSYPHGRPPLMLVARAGSSRPVMKAFGKAIYQGTKMSERTVYFPNGTYLTTAIWNFASNDAYFTFKDDALFFYDKWRQKVSIKEEPWYEAKKSELKALFTDRENGRCDIDPEKILQDIWQACKDHPPCEIRVTFWGHFNFGECRDRKKPMTVVVKACVQMINPAAPSKLPKESFFFIDNFAHIIGDVPC